MSSIRTDLALEAKELYNKTHGEIGRLDGVASSEKLTAGFRVETVRILDDRGERLLCKPKGTYVTIELDDYIKRENEAFARGVECVGEELREMLRLEEKNSVLVACLGNRAVTPDAIGPFTADSVMATRHLKEKEPGLFKTFRDVSVLETGVLGRTGIESAEMIRSITGKTKPDCVIAVDALASMSTDRVCRTIQIADTGIVPGSGVGNARSGINAAALGVPVIAVGVPTVVDAVTLAVNLANGAGISREDTEKLTKAGGTMIVTPREIDARASEISRLPGYGINMGLHPGITVEDINMFVG